MKCGQEITNIEKVTSEKDLGVIVDQALDFSEHINSKVNKANRNLGMIFRIMFSLHIWIWKFS